MKVIFFGLGSIGKRHLQNFKEICKEFGILPEIHAFRTSSNIVETSEVKNLFKEEDINNDYDVAFITNPTSFHYKTLDLIRHKARFFFVEKPLFEKEYAEIADWPKPSNFYIACPLRYKKVMQRLKQELVNLKVLNARVICSTYLPNWRSDDYRKSYSASSELGGGVELDCIHELDYVVDLFGWPESSCHMSGKVSSLEIKSNDTAVYILRYADKFVEVHLDYYGHYPQRKIEIITETDLIVVDLLRNSISFASDNKITVINEEYNQFYLSEMKYFLKSVMNNKDNHSDLTHAYKILQLALGEQ